MLYLIVILVVYTILLLIFIKHFLPDSLFVNIDPDSTHFLYNGKKWFEYRLGDLYYLPHLVDIPNHSKRFPNSIGTNFALMDSGDKIQNIKTTINNKLLKKSDLVLHIRIGDVVGKYTKYISKKFFFKDDEWWDSLVKFINENKISRVILLAGAHMPECLEKSWEYLESKRTFLNSRGIKTIYRLACSPDDDILYSCKAKYFASTGGGYGKLLSEIIESYGGKIFNLAS